MYYKIEKKTGTNEMKKRNRKTVTVRELTRFRLIRILLANDLPLRGSQIETFGQEKEVEQLLPGQAPVLILSALEGENGIPHLPKRSRAAESCKGRRYWQIIISIITIV